MLWDIRALMKPALSVIDMIPDIHRTAALAVWRRAIVEGKPNPVRLSREERELAFHDAAVTLASPIGARVLRALYMGGHLKLKKPARKVLPTLEAYIATEDAFRAEVARVLAAEDARLDRQAQLIADPDLARPDEVTPLLIDKVMTARLGYGAVGEVRIGGLQCHRTMGTRKARENDRLRTEGTLLCWWIDADGNRQGDAELG